VIDASHVTEEQAMMFLIDFTLIDMCRVVRVIIFNILNVVNNSCDKIGDLRINFQNLESGTQLLW
jgi:hypothetical protein